MFNCFYLIGERSNDPEHPDYVPSVWPQMSNDEKEKRKQVLETYLKRKDRKRYVSSNLFGVF